MAWEDEPSRILLLELMLDGQARIRVQQKALRTHLEKAGWVHALPCATEFALSERYRSNVEALLDTVWIDWRSVAEALRTAGLSATPSGIKELRRRQRRVPPLPPRVNRRTAASLVAEHSKATLSPEHLEMLGSTQLMRDGAVLFRPNEGLVLQWNNQIWTTEAIMQVQGVVALTQRSMEDGTMLSGCFPEVVITVENQAAFVDLPKPDWMMLVYVPGWNVPLALQFLEQIPSPIRCLHFGDLDSNGIRIYNFLSRAMDSLELWIPDFWAEVVAHAPPLVEKWPVGVVADIHGKFVRQLEKENRWSEQEIVVLDPRMRSALEALRPPKLRDR